VSSLFDVPGTRRDRFVALYEENYHRVLGYALRRIGADEATDVVAETFLVAWRRLEAVPEGGASRLWLYGTARLIISNQRRAGRRRERLGHRLQSETGRTVAEAGLEVGDCAGAAFASLKAQDREVLALLAWEGLDAGEIAQVLGCSRNAARIRIHRARRRFARELARAQVAKRDAVGGHVSEAYE
jgi:RNA polymerase sigma factor (sigma-70 family)